MLICGSENGEGGCDRGFQSTAGAIPHQAFPTGIGFAMNVEMIAIVTNQRGAFLLTAIQSFDTLIILWACVCAAAVFATRVTVQT